MRIAWRGLAGRRACIATIRRLLCDCSRACHGSGGTSGRARAIRGPLTDLTVERLCIYDVEHRRCRFLARVPREDRDPVSLVLRESVDRELTSHQVDSRLHTSRLTRGREGERHDTFGDGESGVMRRVFKILEEIEADGRLRAAYEFVRVCGEVLDEDGRQDELFLDLYSACGGLGPITGDNGERERLCLAEGAHSQHLGGVVQ